MFTKQYERFLAIANVGATAGTHTFTDYAGATKTFNGSDYSPDYAKVRPVRYNFPLKAAGGSSAGNISFWQGASEPSKDDVKPDGTEVTSIVGTVAIQNTSDENGVECTRVFTLTNSGTTEITIDTVCLAIEHTWAYNKTFSGLVDKTRLDSPVTIPAGGVGQITYTLRINLPTA